MTKQNPNYYDELIAYIKAHADLDLFKPVVQTIGPLKFSRGLEDAYGINVLRRADLMIDGAPCYARAWGFEKIGDYFAEYSAGFQATQRMALALAKNQEKQSGFVDYDPIAWLSLWVDMHCHMLEYHTDFDGFNCCRYARNLKIASKGMIRERYHRRSANIGVDTIDDKTDETDETIVFGNHIIRYAQSHCFVRQILVEHEVPIVSDLLRDFTEQRRKSNVDAQRVRQEELEARRIIERERLAKLDGNRRKLLPTNEQDRQLEKLSWHNLNVERFQKLLFERPMTELAVIYGVSDTAIRMYCDKNDIKRPSKSETTKFYRRRTAQTIPDGETVIVDGEAVPKLSWHEVDTKQLKTLVSKYPANIVGQIYGVSDTTIIRFCNANDISRPTREDIKHRRGLL